MNALALFGATFAFVFAFGFVTRTGYLAAFLSTLAIGVAYLLVFRVVPMRHAMDIAGYLLGGPFGIVASMAAQRAWRDRGARRDSMLTAAELRRGEPADAIYEDLATIRMQAPKQPMPSQPKATRP